MRRYSMHVAWSDEDAEFVATSPEFPGLSALAATETAAVRELKRTLRGAIAAFQRDREPLPQSRHVARYSGQFRLRLPKFLHEQVARHAELNGVSLNALVSTFVAMGIAAEADKASNAAPAVPYITPRRASRAVAEKKRGR